MHCASQTLKTLYLCSLLQVKKGDKKRGGALDGIGAAGGMKASGGGGSTYDDLQQGGSGRRMQFQSSGRQ